MPNVPSLRPLEILCIILVATNCATPGGGGTGRRTPPEWPQGDFDLIAAVSYRMDSEYRIQTERIEHRAELHIAPDQSMDFRSSSGLCQPPSEAEIQMDLSYGRRTFYCQGVQYSLWPAGRTIEGEAWVPVREGIRIRGGCIRSVRNGGRQVCVEYSWRVRLRDTRKHTVLRVLSGY